MLTKAKIGIDVVSLTMKDFDFAQSDSHPERDRRVGYFQLFDFFFYGTTWKQEHKKTFQRQSEGTSSVFYRNLLLIIVP
ncbi:hypothetical protein D1614_20360 [Maribellus luteus]|uniref:Uncharacterized protein n=1 Tax=Maribellus luteus TaxID=2305463 RepID=A0A399SU58_9BACT|nr:hypothetical protein D1614_20360 [Maribellus luteus]